MTEIEILPFDHECMRLLPDEEWQTHPVAVFTEKFSSKVTDITKESKSARKFYRKQDDQIQAFADLYTEIRKMERPTSALPPNKLASGANITSILTKTSLFLNLIILVAKSVAVALSGSLSIISALLDSCVDLLSGVILWWAARAVKKRKRYSYPQGRTRLEPVSIIILSVVMGVTSIQVVKEAIEVIVDMATKMKKGPTVDNVTISLTVSVVVIKFVMWMVCWKIGNSPSTDALAQDHRNDVLSNIIAVICSTISSRIPSVVGLKYLDPVGAILIALYIMWSWWKTGLEHTKSLTGYTATPEFLQKLTFIAVNHHESIEGIDTVRAFHFGFNFLVEVDILLPAEMSLKEAHDIGESLQKKLERLEEVERAFVHLDYEYTHDPNNEHKQV